VVQSETIFVEKKFDFDKKNILILLQR